MAITLVDAMRPSYILVPGEGGCRRHQKRLGVIHPSRFKEVDDE